MSIIDRNIRFEQDDKDVIAALDIEPQDPEAVPVVEALPDEEPTVVPITAMELITARIEALRAVFTATMAQVLGGDALTAKTIFNKLNEDVDREAERFLQMVAAGKLAQQEAAEEEE